MPFWDAIADVFASNTEHLVECPIDPGHTDRPSSIVVEADKHYIRVTLAQMFLRRQSLFLTRYYPAAYSVVGLLFDGKPLDIANAADASRLTLKQDGRGDIVAKNFALSPLLPFKGDVVRVAVSLHAVEGQQELRNHLHTLGEFASLLVVPQLSAAIQLALPLAAGLQRLFGASSSGAHLAYANTFAGAGSKGLLLTGGYIAIIRASRDDVPCDTLWVLNGELRQGATAATASAFDTHDYLLLYIDVREDRDDFNQLPAIKDAMTNALDALTAGDDAKADAYYRIAVAAVLKAPELTKADRRRITKLLKQDFEESRNEGQAHGLVSEDGYDLQARWRAQSMTVEDALALGEPEFAELGVETAARPGS